MRNVKRAVMNLVPKSAAMLCALAVALALAGSASAVDGDSVNGAGSASFSVAPGSFLDQAWETLFAPWRSCDSGSFSVAATSGPGGENASGTMSLAACAVSATATVECLAVQGTQATVAGTVTGGNYLEPGTRLAFLLGEGGPGAGVLGIAIGGCDAVPPISVVIGNGDIVVVDGPHPDEVAPTITVPDSVTREATSAAGAPISWTIGATDDRDPSPVVTCSPPSGSTFPLGSTTVTCTATDAAGNSAQATFVVTVVDTTAPTLVVPTSLTTEATSPTGAIVNYAASASDTVDPAPAFSCSPASGTAYAVGDTVVSCTARDASGNAAHGSFAVHVKGPSEQIGDVVAAVKALDAKQGIVESLDAKLQNVLDALNSAKAGDRAGACKKLDAFVSEVQAQTGKALTQADADRLIADARRIEAVIGCG